MNLLTPSKESFKKLDREKIDQERKMKARFGVPSLRVPSFSIQEIIAYLKLWSLLIFPGGGFLLGRMFRLAICLFNGWMQISGIEIWLSHFFTMAFLIGTLNSVVYHPQEAEDPKEKAFFICFTYLGLFGLILGLCP